MQVINVSQKIDEAQNLIQELKPVLKTFGSFDYEIILKGKEDPVFIIQISFLKFNVWTSIIIQVIERIIKRTYFFTLETKEDQTKITLNIVI
jgi:hypothetical protein